MKHEIGFKGRMLARSEDDGDGRTIEGVAVPFGDVIDVWGERETFDPDTVFEGLDSAKLYYQHDTLIGSITSGENREDGLHITARIADTQQGRDAVALLDEGALDSLSVGFVPIEDRKDKDGVTHRRKVRLLETSLVSWPAYENAKLTNHRNNNQEETPMTEQAEKWTEALAKLTNRQDEQAEILRGIETTLTSRLNQQRGTSPLGEYHSQGELLKALVSDDTGKAEAAREAYNALLSRDYTGSVVADADPQPTWIADRIRILEQKRKIATLLTHQPLPAEGMSMSYLVLKSDTHTVAKQAKEGDSLPFGKVTFGDESAVIDTYGGYGDLSRQRIERMPVGDVSFEMRCLTAAYARATENAARTALYGSIEAIGDTDKLAVGKDRRCSEAQRLDRSHHRRIGQVRRRERNPGLHRREPGRVQGHRAPDRRGQPFPGRLRPRLGHARLARPGINQRPTAPPGRAYARWRAERHRGVHGQERRDHVGVQRLPVPAPGRQHHQPDPPVQRLRLRRVRHHVQAGHPARQVRRRLTMSDTEQDPLTSRLAYLAGTMDDDDRPTLSDMLKTARAYLAPHIAGYTLAQPLLDDVVLGISLDLWQAKDARNGIVGLTVDGVEPFRISTDPMRSAWPKLRAAGIPAGMGVS